MIVDGQIDEENMKYAKKDEKYVLKKLQEQKISSVSETMLMTCNDNGDVYIIKK